jgi:hypothetical protein
VDEGECKASVCQQSTLKSALDIRNEEEGRKALKKLLFSILKSTLTKTYVNCSTKNPARF